MPLRRQRQRCIRYRINAWKKECSEKQTAIDDRDSSLRSRQYVIVGLCILAAILAGALIFCAIVLVRYILLTRKQKKAIEQKADKKTIQRAEESGVLQNLNVLPGDVKCYERFTGRVFSSNKDKLIKITNELNRRMRSENYISLNDFYDELDLTNTGLGYELGWNIDRGYIEPKFSAQLDSDGKPCLVLDFEIPPQSDYTNW